MTELIACIRRNMIYKYQSELIMKISLATTTQTEV